MNIIRTYGREYEIVMVNKDNFIRPLTGSRKENKYKIIAAYDPTINEVFIADGRALYRKIKANQWSSCEPEELCNKVGNQITLGSRIIAELGGRDHLPLDYFKYIHTPRFLCLSSVSQAKSF